MFLQSNNPISWKFQIQRNVTLSTVEAEFVSLIECEKTRNMVKKTYSKKLLIKMF